MNAVPFICISLSPPSSEDVSELELKVVHRSPQKRRRLPPGLPLIGLWQPIPNAQQEIDNWQVLVQLAMRARCNHCLDLRWQGRREQEVGRRGKAKGKRGNRLAISTRSHPAEMQTTILRRLQKKLPCDLSTRMPSALHLIPLTCFSTSPT